MTDYSEILQALSDEQYDAVQVVIDVVCSKMTIHHKDGNQEPEPLTTEQKLKYAAVKERTDYEKIMQGANAFAGYQFPGLDINTAQEIIATLAQASE